MALIKCRECDNEISTMAKVCPNCGAPNNKQGPTKKCKKCGSNVGLKEKKCPNCGASTQLQISTGKGCLIVFLVFAIPVLIIALINPSSTPTTNTSSQKSSEDPNAWKTRDNKSMAYIMMEDFVKRKLKAPSTAEFPGIFDGKLDHVKSLGGQKYRIVSYVDAQNTFGAQIRTRFVGEIQQTSEDEWQLISLNLIEIIL